VRVLARAEPLVAGKHSFGWAGSDMDGKPAPWFAGCVPSFNRMRTLRCDIDGDNKPELLLEFTPLSLLLVHDEQQDLD